jgi:hypothetical protein
MGRVCLSYFDVLLLDGANVQHTAFSAFSSSPLIRQYNPEEQFQIQCHILVRSVALGAHGEKTRKKRVYRIATTYSVFTRC